MKLIISIILFFLLTSGIIRDDISVSKSHRFANQPVFDCIGEVYYERKQQQSCILIDPTHILTSAHAFYRDSGQFLFDSLYIAECTKWIYGNISEKSVLGSTNKFSIKFKGKKYKLKKIIIHEKYLNAVPYRDENGLQLAEGHNYDIAIAELESPILSVKPAELFMGDNELNKRAIKAGYGYIEKSSDFTKARTYYISRKTGGENMIASISAFASSIPLCTEGKKCSFLISLKGIVPKGVLYVLKNGPILRRN